MSIMLIEDDMPWDSRQQVEVTAFHRIETSL